MAINFLDNIQLNQNQLLGARIGLVSSDPTESQQTGDIIYNSGTNILKYWNGTSWVSLTADTVLPTATSTAIGGVKLFSDTDQSVAANAVSAIAGKTYGVQFNSSDQMVVNVPWADGVDGSGSINTLAMFTASDTIGDSIYTQNGGATEAKITGGFFATGYLKDSGGDLGTAGQLLSSTGTLTNWIDAPVSYTKWVAQDVAAPVNDGDLYFLEEDSTNPGVRTGTTTKSGTTITQKLSLSVKSMATASPSDFATDTLLWSDDDAASTWKVQKSHIEDIPVSAWGDATSTVDMGSQKIIDLADPTVAQDAATKAYVDSAVEGGLNVKGGFNAATGAITGGGNLTVGGSRVAVAVGDYYVVTVAGNFFANAATPLTPGDSVLVQTAAAAGASIEDDFAVIQSDTDLATASTVGIGNVNASTANNNEGLSLSYSNGTGTVGLDIKGGLSAATAVADGDRFAMFQGSAEAQGNFSINSQLMADYFRSKNSFAGTSTSGTSHVFTHDLNTSDVIVQVYDASTLETVYANVDRTSVNQVTVTTAATANIRCLVQKIG
jgi:hypothetical protein